MNAKVRKQNSAMIKEANAASRSRGLIKARLTALTAKVSLMESEITSIMEVLNVKITHKAVDGRKEIQRKLLAAAELLGEEE